MTAPSVSRLVARLLVVVVLGASGTYMLVYLYRWEWNRAVLSGLFFVAAEIALGISLLLSRLGRLERRLDNTTTGAAVVVDQAKNENEGKDGDRPFAWLDPTGVGFGVFVPVLLGAGVILSCLALAVEKISGAVARRNGSPSAPSALPVRHSPLAVGAVLIMSGLLVFGAIDVLADATQNRSDPRRVGSTSLVMDVDLRDSGTPVSQATEALWVACRSTLDDPIPSAQVTAEPGRAVLTVDGQLGRNGQRRFV